MVDFEPDELQQEIQKTCRRFAREVVRPVVAEQDAQSTFPMNELRQAHELGLLYSGFPEAIDGMDSSLLTRAMICEEMSWGCPSFASNWVIAELASTPLLLFGSDEQKKKFLGPVQAGLSLMSFALSEPSSGSNVAGITTSAKKHGSDYVLNGTKMWITNAGYADFFVVFATQDPAARERGITAFIVPKDTPGLSIGSPEKKLGLHSSDTREVSFSECVIPESQRLGGDKHGFRIAKAAMMRARPLVAAMATGLSRAALEHATAYALGRKIDGKSIAEFQAIQIKLADMATNVHASRLLTWSAAASIDGGQPSEMKASMAKRFSTDAAMEIATEAVQIFGGYGVTVDYPVEKLMRDAKILQIVEGTSDIMRLIIASHHIAETIRSGALSQT